METLRLLREVAGPGEAVLDPSGLAYFQPPCSDEWYVDTLFGERARRGVWMADLGGRLDDGCPWVLNTYRLGMLTEPVQARVAKEYVLVAGGLGLRRGDSRLVADGRWPALLHQQLESFW